MELLFWNSVIVKKIIAPVQNNDWNEKLNEFEIIGQEEHTHTENFKQETYMKTPTPKREENVVAIFQSRERKQLLHVSTKKQSLPWSKTVMFKKNTPKIKTTHPTKNRQVRERVPDKVTKPKQTQNKWEKKHTQNPTYMFFLVRACLQPGAGHGFPANRVLIQVNNSLQEWDSINQEIINTNYSRYLYSTLSQRQGWAEYAAQD